MTSDSTQTLAVLSHAECHTVRQSVLALRSTWLHRHPTLPFYTLGAASYLDAIGDTPAYARLASQLNPLLRHHFAWLYDRLLATLAQALGAPAGYAATLAVPGFHIFLAAREFEQELASVHFDLQYRLHDWEGQGTDLDHPISFTLAIALPRHGGGLNTWEVSRAERLARPDDTPDALRRGRAMTHHAYDCGYLTLHSGHLLHQMAPGIALQPDDERITLQGHGVRASGVWRLYW